MCRSRVMVAAVENTVEVMVPVHWLKDGVGSAPETGSSSLMAYNHVYCLNEQSCYLFGKTF